MSTNIETNNATSKMPGRRPSLSQSIGQSLSVAFGRKDSYYYEVEFITETPSHHSGEKMQVLTNYATIGRGTNNVIRYKGEGIEGLVSGVHASITRNGGEWTLEHLSQTNRTVINGGQRTIRPDDPFKKYVLQDGDTIQFAKGGPVVRFVVPAENSLQSVRSKTRGTTFVRNIVSQAIAPYKKTIRTLTLSLVAVVLLWGGYAVYENLHHKAVIGELTAELESTRLENAQQVAGMQERIEEQAARIAAQERRRNEETRAPVHESGIDEMMASQGLANDVFFIVAQAVAIVDGQEVTIPNYVRNSAGQIKAIPYLWTATGFLLDDGRLVTARHCVEGWWFGNPFDTTTIAQIARLSVTRGNVELKAKINAYCSKSGRHLTFTSDDFHIDRSKDRVETIATAEDGTELKWRFVFPVVDGWDETMFATDWAWAQTRESGHLAMDGALSNSLPGERQLLVMGFPVGLGAEDANNIEPISYQMHVSRPGLAPNGCIMHSRGTDYGNSGGPIFAVKDGKLVVIGIVSRGDSRSEQYNWAVPISRIGNR